MNLTFLFLGLILLYTLVMTLVYALPGDRVLMHAEESQDVFDMEGDYPKPFFYSIQSQLDGFTDRIMIGKSVGDVGQNPFINAMDIMGYSRYWHGYIAVLRPLLLFFNYLEIRYLNMIVFFMAVGFTSGVLAKKLNAGVSVILMGSLACGYMFLIPMSLQFSSVFYVLLASIAAVCFLSSGRNFDKRVIYAFFVTGSVINFLDFLTAPLLTLGLPLICFILLKIQLGKSYGVKQRLLDIIRLSLSWGAGYGLTWAAKWVLASAVLQKNVIANALTVAALRSGGDTSEEPLNRLQMLKDNLQTMFSPNLMGVFIAILLLWALLMLCFRMPGRVLMESLPLLLVGSFPYFWYVCLANHSQYHVFFTYRVQIITIFAALSFLYLCIDWPKLKRSFLHLFHG